MVNFFNTAVLVYVIPVRRSYKNNTAGIRKCGFKLFSAGRLFLIFDTVLMTIKQIFSGRITKQATNFVGTLSIAFISQRLRYTISN